MDYPPADPALSACQLQVTGVVQGVGFRPFIFNLAERLGLAGTVRNTSGGVVIEVEGAPTALTAFVQAVRAEAPPLARIEQVTVTAGPVRGRRGFHIEASQSQPSAVQPVSPDVAVCAACAHELFDPADRRYLYPFINCTHCGPRYTIIRTLPYDRPATTLADFALCPACQTEYDNPRDRRFHAQPVACPACGPQVWLASANGQRLATGLTAILALRRHVRQGGIAAVQGLGGFQLVCNAADEQAVRTLRARKAREGKPLAVMAADLPTAEQLVRLDAASRAVLTGREKPIVLAERQPGAPVAASVAANLNTLGVMLPYTPLHHLLLNATDPALAAEPAPPVWVVTSGNLSQQPLARTPAEALSQLAGVAEVWLLHNREIFARCDDSVVRATPTGLTHWRRARGYAPYPIHLPQAGPPVLAVGGELKNTLCLTRQAYAFLSPHIGDMGNAETQAVFEATLAHLQALFGVQPQAIIHDLHPTYLTTRWAKRQPGPHVAVQHHHAHIAACLADNGLPGEEPVIGLAFDGTGYGPDGAIWGGEVLVADYRQYQRVGQVEYLPLPGGEAAIHEPWRAVVGYLTALGLPLADLPGLHGRDPRHVAVLVRQVQTGLNAPRTSSMGRLCDVAAALCGVGGVAAYEAQAAIEFEAHAADPLAAEPYPFGLESTPTGWVWRVGALLAALSASARQGAPLAVLSARFHRTLIDMTVAMVEAVRAATGLQQVALSGGVWQNHLLTQGVVTALQARGCTVWQHRHTPPNDGGLALGQAVIGQYLLANGR